jgi:ABC-type bacteriocin/lantibiotic exporter with double-glycine peptidase domain
MTNNVPECPQTYLQEVLVCFSAGGSKISGNLLPVLTDLCHLAGRVVQDDPVWIEARHALAASGRGLSVALPRWNTSAVQDDADVSWGDVWLGCVQGQWQVWHRTPQSGWQQVAGDTAAGFPMAGAVGFSFPILTDSTATDVSSATPSYWKWVLELLRGRIGALMQISLVVNLGMLSLPLFAMLVYDKVVFNGVFETLWALAIGVVLFLALEVMMRALRARQVERLSQVLDERIDGKLFAALLRPTVRAGSQPGMAARFQTMYRDLSGARDFFSANYLLAVADLPFILLIWIVIGVVAWPLLIVVLVWVSVYVWLGSLLKTRTLQIGQRMIKLQLSRQAVLTDSLSSLDLLRTSHIGGKMFSRFMQISREHALQSTLQREEASKSLWLAQVIYAGSYISLLVVGAYLIFDRQMTTGALIAVSMLSGRSLGAIGQALTTLGRWQELKQSLKALAPFLDAPQDTSPTVEARSARQIAGRILVHRVSHTYPDSQPCLHTLHLSIAAGEKVALMGKPGSGKSTMVRAIAGAIVPSEGEVRLDDVALMAHDASARHLLISFKPQEVTLMAGSIEDNILASLPLWATPDQRTHALRRGIYLSGLDQDLASGMLSLDRKVEEYGANLSGGQRQKIALARTLALQARVFILDEPSNGLDTESERLLATRLAELKDATLILVTHSAIMLGLSNRVIALDRGTLVADGPTRELVKTAA